ncbi:unnamed protein product [Peronospora farinosa]|uniref:TATA element modulatory factor 1 TATA binding domain-containing protein n=2 Tax=Peronospora farinosa TaxID=134698 RepID=A0ABN8BXW6_9STRA|nr:unnamed protein product [Peronospora farinosa]
MSSSSPWGGWGTKLNVTSIVSQGLEQVRNLREDVEKSFDQVVTGAPGARVSLPLTLKSQQQIEDKELDKEVITIQNEADVGQNEVIVAVGTTLSEDRKSIEVLEEKIKVEEAEENEKDEHQQNVMNASEQEEGEEEVKEMEMELQEKKEMELQEKKEMELQEGDKQDLKAVEEVALLYEEQEAEQQQEIEIEEKIVEDKEDGVQDEEDTLETTKSVDESNDEEAEQEQVVAAASDDVKVAALVKELEMRESQLLATSATIRELHDELDKTCRREVAAVERADFLTEQLENTRREVAKLTQLHKDASSQNADVQALQMALAEKEEKLSALLDEGQALSVKQAKMEQRLRSLRKEKDELEKQALTSQAQVEASAEEMKKIVSKLKASEEEKTSLMQENLKLARNTELTSARVEKAEQSALEATQQLEKLQAELEKLTLASAIKSEEIERLKMASQSNETLNHEKKELQQTLQFLQANVRDLEKEVARREEMARAEIADLKRKWQDAVARVDILGQSVSEATQPLFRQLHALQEDQRARQDNWKATENTLILRIEEAIEQRRVAEQEKLDMKQQLHEFRRKVEESELEMTRIQAELARSQDAVESTKARARELCGRADALQIELDQAKRQRDEQTEVKEQLQARLANVEKSAKQLQASSAATVELKQIREREEQLRQDLEWHQQELLRLKNLTAQLVSAPVSTGSTSSQRHYVRRRFDGEQPNGSEGVDGELSSEASILKKTLETAMSDQLTLNGHNTSVLRLSQLQQQLRLREGENRMLKQQLETLEARQKQTTGEIVRLSSRNALLESGETQREQAQLELVKLQKHQVVLLELFGEKEEQVEELQAEVKELKAFYRKQLDALATHNEEQQKQRAEQQQ